MTKSERNLNKKIKEIQQRLYAEYDDDSELELDYICELDDREPGWYAYRYIEKRGEAVPFIDECIITDEYAEKHNVNIWNAISGIDCYVCGQ